MSFFSLRISIFCAFFHSFFAQLLNSLFVSFIDDILYNTDFSLLYFNLAVHWLALPKSVQRSLIFGMSGMLEGNWLTISHKLNAPRSHLPLPISLPLYFFNIHT